LYATAAFRDGSNIDPAAALWLAAGPPTGSDSWRFQLYVGQLQQLNGAIHLSNSGLYTALAAATGQSIPDNPEAWKQYYVESVLGYSYDVAGGQQQSTQRQSTNKMIVVNDYPSCFAAGTLVHTRSGLQPIESVKVGERLLTQDTTTGALSYQPVI